MSLRPDSPTAPPPQASAAPAALGLAGLLRLAWLRRRQERSSRLSRAALEQRQAAQLQRLRAFIAERSPFYQRFHRGAEGAALHELPILDKATLMAEFDQVVTDRAIRLADIESYLASGAEGLYLGRYTVLSTSGSSGRRGVFVFDPAEWLTALAAITRPVAWAGTVRSWTPPRAALIASAASWHYSARIGRALSTRLAPTLRLDAAAPVAELVRALQAWQPQVLAAYPSVLLQLAEEQLAGRLHLQLRHIGTSAEPLPQATRERVRQAFGVPVFDTYGATEYAPIAAQCAFGQMHLFEDRALIEVVNTRGRAVPPGEVGERLLLTVLDRRTQPLVRYEISDRVQLVDESRAPPCPCGRPFRRLQQLAGRVEEVLAFAPARPGDAPVAVKPIQLHAVLERAPAAGWQVVQHGPQGRLDIRLAGTLRPGVAQSLRAEVQALLRSLGAAVPDVDVRWVAELERGPTGKALLISVRPAASAA